MKNEEGSYLLETQVGKKLVFDAMRAYDQFGRYLNHASSGGNARYWRPLFVRGKWRVGFVAVRDIQKGDEITYDYGVRGLTWMAPSPVKLDRTKKSGSKPKYNLEEYRKRYFCPVPGCTSNKAQKKLANHIAIEHRSISTEERHAYLAKAKEVAAYAISSASPADNSEHVYSSGGGAIILFCPSTRLPSLCRRGFRTPAEER